MCYHDIYPDRAELRDYSVASLFPDYISGSKIMMSGKQLEFGLGDQVVLLIIWNVREE